MAVADNWNFEVLLYDDAGVRVGAFGRRGDGPGEFRGVSGAGGGRTSLVGGWVADTIWVVDQIGRRVSYFTAAGRLLRTRVLPVLARPGAGSGSVPLAFAPVALGGDGSMLGTGTFGTAAERSDRLLLASPGWETFRSLLPSESYETPRLTLTDPASGRVMTFGVPFTSRVHTAVAQDGERVLAVRTDVAGQSPSLTVTVTDRTGRVILVRQYPTAVVPVGPAQANAFIATVVGDLRGARFEGRRTVSERLVSEYSQRMRAAIPSVAPTIRGAQLGIDHSIWMLGVRRGDSIPYFVLDDAGRPWGEIVVPYGRGRVLAASRSHVWMSHTDDEGFFTVRRYRLLASR